MPHEPHDEQVIPFGTSFDQLPDELLRKCCPRKSCGNTDLVKSSKAVLDPAAAAGAAVAFEYVRESNGDPYFSAKSVDELISLINDPHYYPVDEG